jgi:hypothetical protein
VTRPETWASFDDAAAAYKRGGFDGVGFVLGDGFAGVDLDNCRNPDSGEIAPWAMEIICWVDSYAEVSPSETGVKIICRVTDASRLPSGLRQGGVVEFYSERRYFAITGHALPGFERIEERQSVLEELFPQRRTATGAEAKTPQVGGAPLVVRAVWNFLPKRAKDILDGSVQTNDRSGLSFELACLCVESGMRDAEAIAAIVATAPHHSAKYGERRGGHDAWADALACAEKALAATAASRAQQNAAPNLLRSVAEHSSWVLAAPPVEELWEGLLFRGCVHLLAAPPKRGKSTFLNHLLWHLSGPEEIILEVGGQAYAVVNGTFLGRRFKGGQRVLLVTENAPQFWSRRPVLPGVAVLSAFDVRRAGPQALVELIRSGKFDVIAVDCLDKAVPLRDENANAEIAEVLAPIVNAAHESSVTLILVHHFRKRGGSGGEEIRGGSALFGAVDEYWALGGSERENDGGPLRLCLEPSGRLAPPVRLSFAMTLSDAWLEEPGERRAADTIAAVLDAAQEPLTRAQIAAAAGVPDGTAKRILAAFVKQGTVTQHKNQRGASTYSRAR